MRNVSRVSADPDAAAAMLAREVIGGIPLPDPGHCEQVASAGQLAWDLVPMQPLWLDESRSESGLAVACSPQSFGVIVYYGATPLHDRGSHDRSLHQ